MAVLDTIANWGQLLLNAGALITGGVVWKMYFENLKSTIGTKDSQISLANERVTFWREKAQELERRTPETVERVLAERIAIREQEIERLRDERATGSVELQRLSDEVVLLQRTMESTRGFRSVLAMEQPQPDDPDYDDYLEYVRAGQDRVVDIEVQYLGSVNVDSGQLMITDPCYLDGHWEDEPFGLDFLDTQTGETVVQGVDFAVEGSADPFKGASLRSLLDSGRLTNLPDPPPGSVNIYSYDGACKATLGPEGFGELVFPSTGVNGAAVVFSSGWGDGFYPVFGEKHDGRIVRVYVNCGADPVPPVHETAPTGTPAIDR